MRQVESYITYPLSHLCTHAHTHYPYTTTTLLCSTLIPRRTTPTGYTWHTYGTVHSHGEPNRHGKLLLTATPSVFSSVGNTWPDHRSTIDYFDRSIVWHERTRSVSMSLNWITHQLAPSLRYGLSWFCYMYVYFRFRHVNWALYIYPSSLKFLPSTSCPWIELLLFFSFFFFFWILNFIFMPLSSQNFLFCPSSSSSFSFCLRMFSLSSLRRFSLGDLFCISHSVQPIVSTI